MAEVTACDIQFSTLKVPELQDYLKARGITVTKINRPQLIELCDAVCALRLPVDPDMLNDKQPISSSFLYGIKDPFELDGFTSDLSHIPSFSLYDIFNYLVNKTAAYDSRKLKAYKSCEDYRLFFDGHVDNLLYTEVPEHDICVFKAQVKPTQRDKTYLNKTHYDLWLIINKKNADVQMAYCTCIGGADGACRHVGAVLYEIEAFEVKSVTDGDNLWKKRARQHDCPVAIKRMKLMKPKYSSLKTDGAGTSKIENFDPRALDDRVPYWDDQLTDFAGELRKISSNLQILDVLDTTMTTEINNEISENDASYQKCFSLSVFKAAEKFMEKPNLLSYENFIEGLSLTDENIEVIESCTTGQSDNQLWHEMRKGMITASNFGRVCHAVDTKKSPPSLLKTLIGGYGNVNSAAINWGRKKEKGALDLYMRAAKKQHKGAELDRPGLRVYQHTPYIGCSVDGILYCKCHSARVLEVKCPFSYKEYHPKDAALLKGCKVCNNKVILSPESEYYHQVQGQMGIYGLADCDLIIYTEKGICVINVELDEPFFKSTIEKLQSFFREHLLNYIFQSIRQ